MEDGIEEVVQADFEGEDPAGCPWGGVQISGTDGGQEDATALVILGTDVSKMGPDGRRLLTLRLR